MHPAAPLGPAVLVLLFGPGHRPCVLGHVFCNRGTGRNIGAGSHVHRSHQIGVATDKRIVIDGTAELLESIVVGGDGAAAEIDSAAHVGIPHIRQVRHLGSLSQHAVFQLDKGPDVAMGTHGAVWPDVGVRPYVAALAQGALIDLGSVDHHAVFHGTGVYHRLGADGAVFPDGGFSLDPSAWQQDSPLAYPSPVLHINRRRIQTPNAVFPLPA